MTLLLYQDDSYLKEFSAKITKKEAKESKIFLELDKTAFMPAGGGLPSDKGFIIYKNPAVGEVKLNVVDVKKEGGAVLHEISNEASNEAVNSAKIFEEIRENDEVLGVIEWGRRYRLMRMHTAMHIIGALFNTEYNALVTGNQIDVEVSRLDLNVQNFEKEMVEKIIQKANEIIKSGKEVKIYKMPREEALKIPNIVKLAGAAPPNIPVWRIVEIEGVDIQADGGVHVKNTKEIGEIKLEKIENKGKNNKRVYFSLVDVF